MKAGRGSELHKTRLIRAVPTGKWRQASTITCRRVLHSKCPFQGAIGGFSVDGTACSHAEIHSKWAKWPDTELMHASEMERAHGL